MLLAVAVAVLAAAFVSFLASMLWAVVAVAAVVVAALAAVVLAAAALALVVVVHSGNGCDTGAHDGQYVWFDDMEWTNGPGWVHKRGQQAAAGE